MPGIIQAYGNQPVEFKIADTSTGFITNYSFLSLVNVASNSYNMIFFPTNADIGTYSVNLMLLDTSMNTNRNYSCTI